MIKKKPEEKKDDCIVRPLITLEDGVLTPLIPQPIKIDDSQKDYIGKFTQKSSEAFFVTASEEKGEKTSRIMDVGVIGIIDRVMEMPGTPTLAFIRPIARAKLIKEVYGVDYPMAKISILKKITEPKKKSPVTEGMLQRIKDLVGEIFQYLGPQEKSAIDKVIEENSSSMLQYLYAVSHVAPVQWIDKYLILESNTFNQLVQNLLVILDETMQRISLQAQINEKTHRELTQQQKEAFLREHLKQVRAELGETEATELDELEDKAANKKWSEQVKKHFKKELEKLRRLNVNNPDYSVQYSYLESLLDLPWNEYKTSKISLDKVEKILNRDHYGLDKVKERIMEYMAVLKLRNDLKAPIICLYGPPGVGKTSIGKSVAEAVGREYARISLGGMHDEAEIRGHRRTYIGAMPGRFLHTLTKLKYGNPLILLDEIDKVGKDYKGDPSSALLEALDPEQNNSFHDNFIDYPYDLSKVLFIATANDLTSIPAPLRDRMEVIEMPPYKLEEKREIALRHLVNQVLKDNGFKENEISFTPEAIDTIIKKFTHESGVRQLKMQISKIVRKLALLKVKGKKLPGEISGELVVQYLDKKDSWHNSLGFRG